jgi:Raf kinase inhibitor-like YbhB/YbcL family protein
VRPLLLLTIFATTVAGKESQMKLTSTAFADGAAIPAKYTCESGSEMGVSPPLAWSGVPAGAKSLALIVDDPDAPDPRAPKMTWVHWVLWDLPPTDGSLPEAATRLPEGTREGKNDWKRAGWGGPCPPTGRHRYFFKLYALDKPLGAIAGGTKADLEHAMAKHIVGQAQLIGTYEKRREK